MTIIISISFLNFGEVIFGCFPKCEQVSSLSLLLYFALPSFYTCTISLRDLFCLLCVCTQVCILCLCVPTESRKRCWVSWSISLHPNPLIQGFSMNLKLDWHPASHHDPLVSAFHSTGLTGTNGHSSCLCSKCWVSADHTMLGGVCQGPAMTKLPLARAKTWGLEIQ